MRTRRRPVLQDKTPGNTPQKPKSKATRAAKLELVPVVEIKARVRRSKRGKDVEADEPADVDYAGEYPNTRSHGTRHGRVRHPKAPAAVAQDEARLASARKDTEAPPPKRGRGRPRKVVPKIVTSRKCYNAQSSTPITDPPTAQPVLSPVKRVSLPNADGPSSGEVSSQIIFSLNSPFARLSRPVATPSTGLGGLLLQRGVPPDARETSDPSPVQRACAATPDGYR